MFKCKILVSYAKQNKKYRYCLKFEDTEDNKKKDKMIKV